MNEAQTRFNKIDPKLREMIRGRMIRGTGQGSFSRRKGARPLCALGVLKAVIRKGSAAWEDNNYVGDGATYLTQDQIIYQP